MFIRRLFLVMIPLLPGGGFRCRRRLSARYNVDEPNEPGHYGVVTMRASQSGGFKEIQIHLEVDKKNQSHIAGNASGHGGRDGPAAGH